MNGNISHQSPDIEALRVRPSAGLDEYEQYIAAARQRFANSSGVRTLLSRGEAQFFHSFLLYFCSLGFRMTEPVEGWIRRAADKCAGLGLTTISRVLAAHAQAERGHHLMMIADLRALADLWNRQYRPSADPDALLAQAPSPGVTRYCKIHEDNLAGATPYAQVAIEYEIEMLPLRFGEAFMTRCADVLGPDILSCLSFVTSHIQLDVAHTKTNAWAMAEVFREVPGSTPVLAAAGAAVLDAYAEYLDDCVSLAKQHCHSARYIVTPRRRLWTGVCAHRWQSPTVGMAPSCQSGSRKSGRSVDSCCSTVVGDRPSEPTVEIFATMTPLTYIRITSLPIAARCWSAVYGPIIWRTVLPALPKPFSVKGHSHPFCARLAPSAIMWSSLAAGYSIRATELAAVRPCNWPQAGRRWPFGSQTGP